MKINKKELKRLKDNLMVDTDIIDEFIIKKDCLYYDDPVDLFDGRDTSYEYRILPPVETITDEYIKKYIDILDELTQFEVEGDEYDQYILLGDNYIKIGGMKYYDSYFGYSHFKIQRINDDEVRVLATFAQRDLKVEFEQKN